MAEKRRLFSISISDCDVQTFRSGGKGGQHQNKRETGVRIIHRPSSAVGESREYKSQMQNKRAAFKRMAESPEMRGWIKLHASKLMGQKSPEEIVEELMSPDNLKVEVKNKKGRWVDE